MDLINLIDRHFASQPDKIAYKSRDEDITYRELKIKSDSLAQWITKKNASEGAPIIIRGHKESLMPICFLAASKSGNTYIPIDISVPKERVYDIIENSRAKLLIDLHPAENAWNIKTIKLRQLKEIINNYGNEASYCPNIINGDNDYYVKYTSGSTGKPKGVRITYKNLQSFLSWAIKEYDIKRDDIILNQVIFSFDVSVLDLYSAFIQGATVCVIDDDMIRRPRELFQFLKDANATIMVGTPSFIEYCLYEKSFNAFMLTRLEKIILAGEALARACVANIYDRFPEVAVYNAYGPTEATVLVTSIHISQDILGQYKSLPIGNPAEHIKIIIDSPDDSGKGEIIIKGASVSPGYLNDFERTSKAFFNEDGVQCYRTGDLGYIQNGVVFYCGRIDNQIKISGYRIELEDIESNISSLDYVNKCIVLPKFINDKCHKLVAFILCMEGCDKTNDNIYNQLKVDLKSKLPHYMIPSKVVVVDNFTMTPNGKIDKSKLRNLL